MPNLQLPSEPRDAVLFQMWGPFRQSLIAGHLFYVEQAQKRLLSQFENIEAEAEKASEVWLEQNSSKFDPDRHDSSDFDQLAHNVGIEFYGLLSDMRDQTRLNFVAGMFHEWEKQLRDWLAREIRSWHHGPAAAESVWLENFHKITDLLEGLGFALRGTDYFHELDACRLVVNVYKHGDGSALKQLKEEHPKYLSGPGMMLSSVEYCDHTDLKVSDEQLQAFSKAIVAFWKAVPESILQSQVKELPKWFGKALEKDSTEIKK